MRRQAGRAGGEHLLPLRASHVVTRFPEQNDVELPFRKIESGAGIFAIENADHSDGRRRINRAALGLVVERDVSRNHRRSERQAGLADAADALRELPHDLRPLRRSEIQTIGDRDRPSSASRDVAGRLGHRLLASLVRIEVAVERIDVRSHRQRPAGSLHAHDSRVATLRHCDRVCADGGVVLFVDPVLGTEVRGGQEAQESHGEILLPARGEKVARSAG